tara:strand:+ start:263 stop:970 length:708 start_codon:yes stop_codon:yes gene_type:complete
MKKRDSWIVALVVAVFLCSSQTANAGAPGDGLYVGAIVGHGMTQVSGKVTSLISNADYSTGTYELADGGVSLDGMQYGGLIGYGVKMGTLIGGIEVDYIGSEEEFKLTSSVAAEVKKGRTITQITAQKNWTASPTFRLGVYINKDTVLSLKGGVVATEFEVDAGYAKSTYTGFGPRYGVNLETAFMDNVSLRVEYLVTDYLTAPLYGIGADTGRAADTEISGLDTSARLGVIFTF